MTDLAVRPSDALAVVAEYHTPEQWGVIVRTDLGRSVQGVIDAGRHLTEAKGQIEHGQWEKWLDAEVGITRPTANRLMLVAGHPTISNRAHVNGLPSSWGTLYQLSQLEPAQLEAAIIDGEVTPALERKQAKALVARYRIEPVSAPPISAPPMSTGLVSVIVADPPWRYGNTVTRAAAEDHYPTMSIDELCDLPVARDRAADDAHLYLWTTAGHLPDAFRVMQAWGFEYKTYLVWAKSQMGMGNYFRISTELVLFGVRGRLPVEDRGIKNWFEARRSQHSKKPEEFLDLVKRASPGPYLEMFSRCNAGQQLSSIEVKTDEMSAKTGKVYLEVQCLYRGEWKHSGVASSTADLWAHVMADEVVIVAPTHLVRRIAAYWWLSNKFLAECKRGSHPTKGVALPIKLFLNNLTDGIPDAPEALPRPCDNPDGAA